VLAVDVAEDKLALARALGVDATVNAAAPGATGSIVTLTDGGAHGVLVTAMSARRWRRRPNRASWSILRSAERNGPTLEYWRADCEKYGHLHGMFRSCCGIFPN
jgi:hypothetical protein